ncbi:hypothetical protein AYK86_12795 [Acinetobacter venetianus]|uniref:hypothetical protein n=1 Tax=Acinetobacter venetianus TaxID=52133 RepID=UPI0007759DE3|nr:hypothetical protein [Acinetobacter venetianus]KXO86756.1 hypothetical protein AYK86_12795 [Acinetobacter venetianus]
MGEKFEFNIQESLQAIQKILNIAEKYVEHDGFNGELAKALLALRSTINDSSFISTLNNRLITCRNFAGLKLERAWDGGFANFGKDDEVVRLHRLAIFLIIYFKELSFRGNFYIDQGHDFYFLNKLVRENRDQFLEKSAWCLDLFDDLPTLIMQDEFHSEHALAISHAMKSTDINKVDEFIRTKDESIAKIDTWNIEYEQKESAVKNLKDKLDTYQTAFNFVGLYQGFSQLKKNKDDELFGLNIQYYILIFFMAGMPIVEFIWLFNNFDENFKTVHLVVLALPSITLLFILFWFFRIILHNIKSVKSQIMQLELRMTLCQFIQSYAEKSKELKVANKEGFEKFENLIFSSIVSSDEKIPSTFDGMEHITNFVKNFKSNS